MENSTEDSKEVPLPAPGLVAANITVMTGAGDPPGSPTGVSNTKTVSGYRDLHEHEAELTPDSELSECSRILRNTYSEDETPLPTSSGLPVSHANMHSNTTCIQPPPCACAPHAIAVGAKHTGRTKSQKEAKKSRHTQSQRRQGKGEAEKLREEPKPSEAEKLREWQRSCQRQGRQEQAMNPIATLPSGQWLPARNYVYDKRLLTKKISLVVNKSSNTSSDAQPLPSETKGLRLLQGYVSYRDSDGIVRTGRVKLDLVRTDVTHCLAYLCLDPGAHGSLGQYRELKVTCSP